jgi:4,5-dihydroxyphthalate decarboxylase
MADLKLSLVCQDYDRTRALMDGTVRAQGIELDCVNLFPARIFERLFTKHEFDVAEMGLTFYLGMLGKGDAPYIGIPVFLSRVFRHSSIFVNAASGIEQPRDLIGRKWGELFTYGHDAGVWSKGIISDEYAVPADSYSAYYVGGVDQPAAPWGWLPFAPPEGARIEHIGAARTLDSMLESGAIDVLFSAMVPPSLESRSRRVRRLFDNAETVEREWFRRTGIFPIMHIVVIRRDIYEKNRWVARALYDAFEASRKKVYEIFRSAHGNMHRILSIPWVTELFEENAKLMGEEPWSYGLEANRKVIDTFLRYHYEQGISKRRFTPDELFAPETMAD